MRIFKNGFWYWLARYVPRALRYHVVIMCTANYACDYAPNEEVPLIRAMDVAKWLE